MTLLSTDTPRFFKDFINHNLRIGNAHRSKRAMNSATNDRRASVAIATAARREDQTSRRNVTREEMIINRPARRDARRSKGSSRSTAARDEWRIDGTLSRDRERFRSATSVRDPATSTPQCHPDLRYANRPPLLSWIIDHARRIRVPRSRDFNALKSSDNEYYVFRPLEKTRPENITHII